jgi:hypothetical protein
VEGVPSPVLDQVLMVSLYSPGRGVVVLNETSPVNCLNNAFPNLNGLMEYILGLPRGEISGSGAALNVDTSIHIITASPGPTASSTLSRRLLGGGGGAAAAAPPSAPASGSGAAGLLVRRRLTASLALSPFGSGKDGKGNVTNLVRKQGFYGITFNILTHTKALAEELTKRLRADVPAEQVLGGEPAQTPMEKLIASVVQSMGHGYVVVGGGGRRGSGDVRLLSNHTNATTASGFANAISSPSPSPSSSSSSSSSSSTLMPSASNSSAFPSVSSMTPSPSPAPPATTNRTAPLTAEVFTDSVEIIQITYSFSMFALILDWLVKNALSIICGVSFLILFVCILMGWKEFCRKRAETAARRKKEDNDAKLAGYRDTIREALYRAAESRARFGGLKSLQADGRTLEDEGLEASTVASMDLGGTAEGSALLTIDSNPNHVSSTSTSASAADRQAAAEEGEGAGVEGEAAGDALQVQQHQQQQRARAAPTGRAKASLSSTASRSAFSSGRQSPSGSSTGASGGNDGSSSSGSGSSPPRDSEVTAFSSPTFAGKALASKAREVSDASQGLLSKAAGGVKKVGGVVFSGLKSKLGGAGRSLVGSPASSPQQKSPFSPSFKQSSSPNLPGQAK